MGLLPDTGCACAGNVSPSRVSDPGMHHGRAWPLSDKKPVGFLSDSGYVRAVMHAGMAN